MQTSLKQAWVAALRSGRFTQTTETLKDLQGFCCLGVLCKVMQENPRLRPEGLTIEEGAARLEVAMLSVDDGESGYAANELPTSLQFELGLQDHVGILMQMNDGSDGIPRRTFPEIAAFIETNVK